MSHKYMDTYKQNNGYFTNIRHKYEPNLMALFYLTEKLQAIWLILIQFLRPR